MPRRADATRRSSWTAGGRSRANALALVTAAALALTGCGTDDPAAETAPAPSAPASPTAAATASPTEAASPTPTPDDAQVVAVTLAGGQVSGVQPRTPVPLGTTVRLSITSDEADEVHVHGFDLTQAVTPGQTAQLEFVADQPGVFEVEMHDSGTVLTRLQVQ